MTSTETPQPNLPPPTGGPPGPQLPPPNGAAAGTIPPALAGPGRKRGPAVSAVKTPIRHALATGGGVPHALHDTTTAAMTLFAVAGLLHISRAPWLWVAAVALVCVIGLTATQRRVWEHAPSTWFAFAASLSGGVWLTLCTAFSPYNGILIGALVLAACAFGFLYSNVRQVQAKEEAIQVEVRKAQYAEARRSTWETILSKAGVRDVRIDREYNDNGFTKGEKITNGSLILRLILGDEAPTFKGLLVFLQDIEKAAASRVSHPVRTGSFQLQQPAQQANVAELIIPTKDILDELIPTPRWTGPRSIKDGLIPGRAVDSTDFVMHVLKNGHGMFTGKTEAGKTNVLNAHLFETTRCTDNVNWYIVGKAKAIRGLKPWLRPWLMKMPHPKDPTKTINPVLDWVAPSWEEACLMLLDAYKAVGVRQELGGIEDTDDQWNVTDDTPHISIFIDESPDLLLDERKFPIEAFDGKRYTFGELLVNVLRLARSEAIRVYLLVQKATNSMLGLDAGDIRSQVTYRIGLRANGTIEINSTFNSETTGIELNDLPDGAFYGERKGDKRPVLCKSFRYEAEDIEWAAIHHAEYAASLDQGTADGLDYYAERWTRPNQQDFFRTLMRRGGGIYSKKSGSEAPAGGTATAVLDPDTADLEDMLKVEPDMSDPDIAKMWQAMKDAGYLDKDDDAPVDQTGPAGPTDTPPPTGGTGGGAGGAQDGDLSDDERDMFAELTKVFEQPEPDPLSPEARALVDLIGSSELEFARGWLFTSDLRAAVIEAGLWPDQNDNLIDQTISNVMAELGLTKENKGKSRVPDETGRKVTGFNATMLRQALHQYRK